MQFVAIGDIHGCLGKLERLLVKMNDLDLQPDDQFVFLGDYVDRGPDSCGVIALLLELQRQRPNTVFLRGNHEQMMLDARDHFDGSVSPNSTVDPLMWFSNGAETTIGSYPPIDGRWYDRIHASHWTFIAETKMEHVTDRYHFVHAGVAPLRYKDPYGLDPRLWIHEPFLVHRDLFDNRIVVFGHTPFKEVLIQDNKIGLDTGAVFGGPLTAAVLSETEPIRIVQCA